MNTLTLGVVCAGIVALPLACGSTPTHPSPLPIGSCPATVDASLSTKGIDLKGRSPARPIRRPAAHSHQSAEGVNSEVPSADGLWAGWYRIVGCTRSCGLGPNVCDTYRAGQGARFGLDLTLKEQAQALSGTIDLLNNLGNRIVETGSITGTIDSAGALALAGTTDTTDASDPSHSTVDSWNSAITSDGSSMTGHFTRTQSFKNFWGSQQITMECQLEDMQRDVSGAK
jgi:hypothetical protein